MAQTIDWRTNIIRPGLAQEGFIAEREGLHGSLEFTYLPPLPNATEAAQGRIEGLQATGRHGDACDEMTKFVAEYLQTWSEQAQVELASIRCLRPPLLFRMFKILCNAGSSDPRPGPTREVRTGEQIAGKS